MKRKSTTSDPMPSIGMGVTMQVGSDRFPGTIIQVTQNGRRIVFQEDEAIRLDKNGMSESQNYTYRPCATCTMYIATLRKDGKYRLTGGKVPVYIGYRDRYYDYSF